MNTEYRAEDSVSIVYPIKESVNYSPPMGNSSGVPIPNLYAQGSASENISIMGLVVEKIQDAVQYIGDLFR